MNLRTLLGASLLSIGCFHKNDEVADKNTFTVPLDYSMSITVEYDRNGDGELDMQTATALFPADETHPEHRLVETLVDNDFDGLPDKGSVSVYIYNPSKGWVVIAEGPYGTEPNW